jgi:hypothetical protein
MTDQESSRFFEKKRRKKLFLIWSGGFRRQWARFKKFFAATAGRSFCLQKGGYWPDLISSAITFIPSVAGWG